MSVLYNVLTRTTLLPYRSIEGMIQFRYMSSRKISEKLPPPADRSTVILGKWKESVYEPISGVSDKQYPILVKWNKPVRVETCNPSISGDIGGLEFFGEVDITKPPVELEGSKEFADSEAVVQKILSLEFCRRKDLLKKLKKDVAATVRRHNLDMDSLEVRIAMLTIKIRNYQNDLIERFPYKNQPLKHDLTFKIALRRSLLEILREQDYRKFEWLLEKLNIVYKSRLEYDDGSVVSRKASIERLTDMWCDELKKRRLDAYKRSLQLEQPKFLRSKAEKLMHILNEEKELGLEITVKQSEIDECLSRAVKIEERNAAMEHIPATYQVYVEEEVKEKKFISS